MNITIYYLSKKIIISTNNQNTENQSFKNLDDISKSEFFGEFEKFINQDVKNELFFYSKTIDKAIDKIKKVFKLIYAAGGLIEKDNKYLFIYRLKKWDLPKGKLDMGEGPDEAAIRECEEECGISELKIIKELNPTFHIYPHKGGYAIKKTFWYAMSSSYSGKLVPQLEESIERVEWFTKEEIKKDVLNDTYPAILEVLHTIL
jgi:8-oxo-dGTP pyrophosphatase MutT (NUDIX family)